MGRVLGGLGRTLVAAGVLVLLFVVYQLWGTRLSEIRGQDDLRRQLGPVPQSTTQSTPPAVPFGPPSEGAPVGIIEIPRIGTNKVVVQGVSTDDLHKAPGHYPTTPLPGQTGNAAIAGHRTTYGAPFYDLNELRPGDQIVTSTRQGRFVYSVFKSVVVAPSDTSVLDPTPKPQLTLTTCNPRFSAAQRLVVMASLVGPAIAAPPIAAPPPPQLAAGHNLAGGQGSWWPACVWGAVVVALVAAAWLAARRWRRWLAYLIATPLILAALFVFFASVSPLLPASI